MWRSTIMIAAWRSWEWCGRFRSSRSAPGGVSERRTMAQLGLCSRRRAGGRLAATLANANAIGIAAGSRASVAEPVAAGRHPAFAHI